MRLTPRERKIINSPTCWLSKSELKIYQRVNKALLEERIESIRDMYRRGMDLSGQDSIMVSAALGFIPKEYNIGNYERKA